MKAWTKPKEVDWFEYTGDSPEFREWCASVNLIVRPQGEDLNLRMPERNYPDERKCAPLTLYKHLGNCVIIRGESSLARMPKEHFDKHYTSVPTLLTKEFLGNVFNTWSKEKDAIIDYLENGEVRDWVGNKIQDIKDGVDTEMRKNYLRNLGIEEPINVTAALHKKIYQPKDNDPIWITVGHDYSVTPPIYEVIKIGTFIDNSVFKGTYEECIKVADEFREKWKASQ